MVFNYANAVLILVFASALASVILVAVGVILAWRYRTAIVKYVETMPSTNLRIAVTLSLIIGTAVRYLVWGIPGKPDGNGWEAWLIFLGSLAGIDVGQFVGKRLSAKPEMFAAGLSRESVDPAPPAPGVATAPVAPVTVGPVTLTPVPAGPTGAQPTNERGDD